MRKKTPALIPTYLVLSIAIIVVFFLNVLGVLKLSDSFFSIVLAAWFIAAYAVTTIIRSKLGKRR